MCWAVHIMVSFSWTLNRAWGIKWWKTWWSLTISSDIWVILGSSHSSPCIAFSLVLSWFPLLLMWQTNSRIHLFFRSGQLSLIHVATFFISCSSVSSLSVNCSCGHFCFNCLILLEVGVSASLQKLWSFYCR